MRGRTDAAGASGPPGSAAGSGRGVRGVRRGLRFVLAMAWRESRRGRRRLALYLAAVSAGVAALVAVEGFRENVTASVRAQARALLGADLELRSRRPFPDSVEAVLDSVARSGLRVARVTQFASMVLAPRTGRTRLADVRAVEGDFPFYGAVETEPPDLWHAFREGRNVLADPALLVYLDARVGDTLRVGATPFVVAGVVTNLPGDVGLRTAVGPRVFLPARYLDETGLLGFGHRARYRAYVEWPDPVAVERFLTRHNALFARYGVGSETVAEEEQDVTRAVEQLARYLGLVGLVALLLGGLGVASAVGVFVRGKLDTAAVLRCLGARPRTVLAIYVVQAAALGFLGAVLGVVLGALVQAAFPAVVRELLPLDVAVRVRGSAVAAGLAIGTGTATCFALLPLLRLKDVPPLRALRREFDPGAPRLDAPRCAVYAALLAGLLGLAVWQAPTRGVGLAFAAGVLATAGVLWATARALMHATRRLFPRRAPYAVRQGIANLFRPHNLTVPVTLALGFGAFLVATLYVVQRNLVQGLALDAGPDRPNLVLFDVQADQAAGVAAILDAHGVRRLGTTPIVPARIAAVNGRPTDSVRAAPGRPPPSRWALRREYRNTYRDTLTRSERLVAGEWWAAPRAPGALPRISVEEEIAADLGLRLGDRVTWDVQGVLVETRVASLRRVEWARFEPNFFVVFEPGVLEEAPQSFVLLAREDDAARRAAAIRDVVDAYPNVSALDLTLVQQVLDRVLGRVALAVRFMAAFSIGAGLVILLGALAASRAQRARESVLLKTLGATAAQVRRILLVEYVAWGSLAAATGTGLAAVAGWALIDLWFGLPYRLPAPELAAAWVALCALTALVGFAGHGAALRRPPLTVLRELAE